MLLVKSANVERSWRPTLPCAEPTRLESVEKFCQMTVLKLLRPSCDIFDVRPRPVEMAEILSTDTTPPGGTRPPMAFPIFVDSVAIVPELNVPIFAVATVSTSVVRK